MERQKKVMMAAEGGDRLSNLPESILLYILSLLPNSKQVVQTSVLSSQWRFLWKSVPVSIEFDFSDGPKAYREKHILAYTLPKLHRQIMAAAREGDRLSNLPESIRIHILSKLPSKQVVQTSVLSSQWVSHWKSVPASLKFESTDDEDVSGFVRSVYRELFYWESCDKIKSFSICPSTYSGHVMDSDLYFWLHFSTYIAKVEEFSLKFCVKAFPEIVYDFPEFAYTNTVLRNLVLQNCELKPFGDVKWSNLVSLSIGDAEIKEDALEKILSGSPNLECLELDKVVGIRLLKISSVKLRKLIVTMYERLDEFYCIEIDAPYIRQLELKGSCYNEMHFQLRNV
uniref:F-box domain-containing protein n=1 Tax=Solanum lycopersicum TaxID=4081 RepID=A0A3Q7HJK8_SOLLC